MNTTVYKRVVSFALAAMLLVGIFPTTTVFAAPPPEAPFVVQAERGAGALNLTDAGDLDWVHVSKQIVRKSGGSGEIQNISTTGDEFKDSPVEFFWRDGSPTASGSNVKTGGVFGQEYSFQIASAPYDRMLTFVSGSWNSQNTLTFTTEADAAPYTVERTAGSNAVTQRYTVLVRSGHGLKVKCVKTSSGGNITLSGIALAKVAGAANTQVLTVGTAPSPLNLTKLGDLDWMHLKDGSTVNRKLSGAILSVTANSSYPVDNAGSAGVAYSWSDGNPTLSDGGNTNAAVYSYQAGVESSVNTDIVGPSGYTITVPAASQARTLQFVSGAWNAAAKTSVYLDGSNEPADTHSFSAEGNSNVYLFTAAIGAGQSAKIVTEYTKKTQQHGNITLGGIALSTKSGLTVSAPPASMDLTALGQLDWMHLANQSSRKDTSAPMLMVETLAHTEVTQLGDSITRYFWSDGTPVISGDAVRTGAVYTYKKPEQHQGPVSEDNGYAISVPTDAQPRTLQFVSGAWQASADILLYLDGQLVDTAYLSAGGSPNAQQFTAHIGAGQSARIEAHCTNKTNGDGNLSLGGVALFVADQRSSKEKCVALLADIAAADIVDDGSPAVLQLKREIAYVEALLADNSATESDFALAYPALELAYKNTAYATEGLYKHETNPGLASSFGWEGDIYAPIAYIDGSYRLRDYGNTMITFGVTDIPGKIKWYNGDDYLPSFISEFSKDSVDYTIESFADEVFIDNNRYEIAYSRMTIHNQSGAQIKMPKVSAALIPLNADAKATSIPAGTQVVCDYAVPADRFGGTYGWPTAAQVEAAGDFDTHYAHMSDYWNDRLTPLAEIVQLPDESLINAYKAGFIYTLIIRDDIPTADGIIKSLHVGENGYKEMFDHDTIGIVATLLTIGDYTYAEDYLRSLPAQLQYDDAKWKYSWPYALYLQKTGNADFVRSRFDAIKENTHKIETDRTDGGTGIIKKTDAIDSYGFWTIDDWSALHGLTTYRYICEQLGEDAEAQWAADEYADLLHVSTEAMEDLMVQKGLDYLPFSMEMSNEDSANPRRDPRDANWASMFLFGRWGWDGYLFGAEQSGVMLDKIDDTYTHGFQRREGITDNPYNFGGYPHGFFSSAYNAGYGSTALRGEQYRDSGIKAYQFMIEEAMSGPFGWWEGVDWQKDDSPWDISHASGGGGSCQHMWGQSTATKVLFDALIAAKSDGSVIIGRGIPKEWIADNHPIQISNYPVDGNNRIGYTLETTGTQITVTFSGDMSVTPASIELIALKDNIRSVSVEGAVIDRAGGTVLLPAGTTSAVITMGEAMITGDLPSVDKTDLLLEIGDQEDLTVDLGRNTAAAQEVTITSEDSDIASVDQPNLIDSGKVTVSAQAEGSTRIALGWSGGDRDGETDYVNVLVRPTLGASNVITFVDGDRIVATGKVSDGETFPIWPADPTKTGYLFDGWFDAQVGGSEYTASSQFFQSTTLYARWTAEEGPIDPVDPVDPVPPTSPGRSTSSRSSSTGSSVQDTDRKSSSAATPKDLDKASAAKLAAQAVAQAQQNGQSTATISLKNPGTLSLDALKAMAGAGDMPMTLHADSMNPAGNGVDVRISLDPRKASTALNLHASSTSAKAKATRAQLGKWFQNQMQIVCFDQADFGQTVEVAVKLDLELKGETLYLYSYNQAANSYVRLQPTHRIDQNGYLHFSTQVGGVMVISSGPLQA